MHSSRKLMGRDTGGEFLSTERTLNNLQQHAVYMQRWRKVHFLSDDYDFSDGRPIKYSFFRLVLDEDFWRSCWQSLNGSKVKDGEFEEVDKQSS